MCCLFARGDGLGSILVSLVVWDSDLDLAGSSIIDDSTTSVTSMSQVRWVCKSDVCQQKNSCLPPNSGAHPKPSCTLQVFRTKCRSRFYILDPSLPVAYSDVYLFKKLRWVRGGSGLRRTVDDINIGHKFP